MAHFGFRVAGTVCVTEIVVGMTGGIDVIAGVWNLLLL
jgi:hypothetical protein